MQHAKVDYGDNEALEWIKNHKGTIWTHAVTERTYIITNAVWMNDTDEWGVLYVSQDREELFIRSYKNFTGIHPVKQVERFGRYPTSSDIVDKGMPYKEAEFTPAPEPDPEPVTFNEPEADFDNGTR